MTDELKKDFPVDLARIRDLASGRDEWFAMGREEKSYFINFGDDWNAVRWMDDQKKRMSEWVEREGVHLVKQHVYSELEELANAAANEIETLRAILQAATSDASQGGLTDDATQADLWLYAKQLAKNQGYSTVEAAIKAAPVNPMQASQEIRGGEQVSSRCAECAGRGTYDVENNPVCVRCNGIGRLNVLSGKAAQIVGTLLGSGTPEDHEYVLGMLKEIAPTADDAKPVGEAVTPEAVAEMCAKFAELYWTDHGAGKDVEAACKEIAEACRDWAVNHVAATAQPPKEDAVDAQRYRWLRDTLHGAKAGGGVEVNERLQVYETPESGEEVRVYWYQDTPVGFYEHKSVTLDAAIDAAIAASAPKGDGND